MYYENSSRKKHNIVFATYDIRRKFQQFRSNPLIYNAS